MKARIERVWVAKVALKSEQELNDGKKKREQIKKITSQRSAIEQME